ncbi:hypothetical protein Ancab_012683 [Ancistrocladus abbreviatus]
MIAKKAFQCGPKISDRCGPSEVKLSKRQPAHRKCKGSGGNGAVAVSGSGSGDGSVDFGVELAFRILRYWVIGFQISDGGCASCGSSDGGLRRFGFSSGRERRLWWVLGVLFIAERMCLWWTADDGGAVVIDYCGEFEAGTSIAAEGFMGNWELGKRIRRR